MKNPSPAGEASPSPQGKVEKEGIFNAIITMHNNRVDLVGVVRPAVQLAEVVDVLQVPVARTQNVGLRRRRAVVLLAERVELGVQSRVVARVHDWHHVVDALHVDGSCW